MTAAKVTPFTPSTVRSTFNGSCECFDGGTVETHYFSTTS